MTPLKKKMQEKEITQYAISFGAKVPASYLSIYEKGYPILKRHHKEAIAKFLGEKIEDVFPEEGK